MIHLPTEFISSFPFWMPFPLLTLLNWLELPVLCWMEVMGVDILALFLILRGKSSSIFFGIVCFFLLLLWLILFIRLRFLCIPNLLGSISYMHVLLQIFLSFVKYFVSSHPVLLSFQSIGIMVTKIIYMHIE